MKKFTVTASFLVLVCLATAFAQSHGITSTSANSDDADHVVILKGGKASLYKATVVGDTVTMIKIPVRILDMGGSNPNPTPTPPSGSLEEFVTKQVNLVPEHQFKKQIRLALSAVYQELGEQYKKGAFKSPSEFMEKRKQIVDQATSLLGSKSYWEPFDKALVAELNKRDPETKKIPESCAEIAKGLAKGEFINPALISAVLQLVMGFISGNQEQIAAGIQALIAAIINR